MIKTILDIGFLIAAISFINGLRRLSTPATARKGNLIAGAGMILAIIIAIIYPLGDEGSGNYPWIIGGIAIGSLIGWVAAKKVQMTAMPQLVSIFNGLGGACAVLLAVLEMLKSSADNKIGIAISVFTLLVGAISFTGSILAYLKLDGKVKDKHVILPGHTYVNIAFLIASIVIAVLYVLNPSSTMLIVLIVISLVYGFSFVAPIGGADMPVVISLLNSLTGISAATAGFIYNNQIMIIGGILVGASGTILTVLMCNAMNRSLLNVIIGGFGSSGGSSSGADLDGKTAKEVSSYDAAVMLNYSSSVMIVPGYGLAVAQAQKVCKELDELLSENGVDVNYAIHPVAGRMPGHMNVLLAEADVPYAKLKDLDEANAMLPSTDVVVIVGANDVVNPSALDDPGSPVYGMPVLKVWEAKNVIIMKRSMSPGYAGIQNPLFFNDNSSMFFGDAKDSINKLVTEIKSLG
ncbi:NAD(P)(+) transhydrogenase (Re/Si-specific) subunit beta [Portibacter lacus]|uniref:NAD(P) transhydrogenase subunit beta n=1 Tax=Portibacter lacus TaxID=1099794 RepID=A0AA37WE70_9BACT|nr:NAD(P)(+) transhydrogenase (Re/Si-specific) subunit beta [Portibacter lacus]GLR18596.1 NAD(P) transhydrogenase subunit beta [Portibacter lacus]